MYENSYIDTMCTRITQARMRKGVSARDMSLSLGQSESYMNKIENRKSLPSFESFFAICEFLELEPKDLLYTEQEHPIQIKLAIKEMNKMSYEQLGRLIDLMRDINGAPKK